MDTKTIAMLLIGVIVGSVSGYYGNLMMTQPILSDLQDRLQTLEDDYGSLNANLTELSADKADLEQQLETLQGAYVGLQAEKESLNEEKQALIEQVETLSSMYESLLEEYQTSLGGLDFSNQTYPTIQRDFTWNYKGETYEVSMLVPEPMYDFYSGKARYVTSDYRGYILHPYDDKYIKVILREFDGIAALWNMTRDQEIGLIISFVQSMHYITDDTTGFDEYPKFPVETLVDSGGDCEDTSILLAHLLEAMEVDAALLNLPGHMAVGIDVSASGVHWEVGNQTFYYMETTATGWDIGEIPIEHVGKTVTVYSIDSIPFLMHKWTATRTNNVVDVTITYTNDDAVKGTGYRAWIGVELDSGELWTEKVGTELNLGFGESNTISMSIMGPRRDTMRLIVGVLTPSGEVITKKYSEYFTTR